MGRESRYLIRGNVTGFIASCVLRTCGEGTRVNSSITKTVFEFRSGMARRVTGLVRILSGGGLPRFLRMSRAGRVRWTLWGYFYSLPCSSCSIYAVRARSTYIEFIHPACHARNVTAFSYSAHANQEQKTTRAYPYGGSNENARRRWEDGPKMCTCASCCDVGNPINLRKFTEDRLQLR